MIMLERIDASPDEIAETVLRRKPKTDWRYLQKKPAEQQSVWVK